MSGPVSALDAPPVPDCGEAAPRCVTLADSREERIGSVRVRRALPRRERRTVGAWCFADHMGPASVTETSGLDIGPHPHIGLQTVTWLIDGQVLHRDSLGSEQVVAPGQLNLMTAGHGVSHSEEATGRYRGRLEGIQLWVAQPSAMREGPPAFEHHPELPRVGLGRAIATVLVGELAGAVSPARRHIPLVGVDLALQPGPCPVPLHSSWEHALVVLRGAVRIDGRPVGPGRLAYVGEGREELALDATEPARVVLLGGEPFKEKIFMWWNFVGRSRDEIGDAYQSWQRDDDRFGRVSSALPRIPAPPLPWSGRARR